MIQTILQIKQKAVTNNILRVMDRRGLNQKQLAKLMDMDASYLSRLLSGRVNYTFDTLIKIEVALQIELVCTDPKLDVRARAPLVVLCPNYSNTFKGITLSSLTES